MDKREIKTLEAIHSSFAKLINEKDYDDITIQDILNDSGVGRSTFYSHYKTKQELLLSVSHHIFEHVFSHSLEEEKTHDFSKDSFYDYRHLIVHIFYHIKDENVFFKGIMSNKSNSLFIEVLKEHFSRFVNSYYSNYPYNNEIVSLELKKSLAVDNFITIIRYWIQNDFKESPEEIGEIYIKVLFAI